MARGALAGVLGGTAVLAVRRPDTRPVRDLVLLGSGVLALLALAVASARIGADHRQDTLADELSAQLGGTTLAQYHDREAHDRLEQEVFGTVSVRSD